MAWVFYRQNEENEENNNEYLKLFHKDDKQFQKEF
jgi:hypothetical protein